MTDIEHLMDMEPKRAFDVLERGSFAGQSVTRGNSTSFSDGRGLRQLDQAWKFNIVL
jgi:hypothetical protein